MSLLAVATFAQLLRECAPNIGARTMTALVRVESGGNPNALHDNTLGRSFQAVDAREAAAWAKQLLVRRHNIDLGLSQINSANLGKLGMSVDEAFDPCANVHGGATILAFDYRAAVEKFGAGQFALRRAIGAYNTGSLFEGDGYVSQILAAAGVSAQRDILVPDLRGMPVSASFLFRSRERAPRRLIAHAPATAARAVATAPGFTPFNAPLLVTNGIGAPAVPSSLPSVAATARPAATNVPLAPAQSGILVPVGAPAPQTPAQAASPKP